MKDFKTLIVWQKSHRLCLEVYDISSSFPREELYGLTSQIRRSSSSIPTNIAESCGRGSDADFARFLQIAMGSASELKYQLILSHDLGFLPKQKHQTLEENTNEVQRMLASLIKKLKANR